MCFLEWGGSVVAETFGTVGGASNLQYRILECRRNRQALATWFMHGAVRLPIARHDAGYGIALAPA
jgi:hypothetical protein